MPPLLTARNWPQTLPLAARLLLIAVAATLLACRPAAQPVPVDDAALPPTQQIGGADSTYDPNYIPPLPPRPTLKYPNLDHNLDTLAVEADAAQADGSHSCTGPASPGVRVRIWMSNNAEDAKTRDLVKWLETQGIPPDYIDVRDWSYDEVGSNIGVSSLPTRLLGPVTQREGVTEVKDASNEILPPQYIPGSPRPKYPSLGHFSSYLEEAQANAGPGLVEAKTRKVFVLIELSSGDSGEPMLAWLQSNSVTETNDWRYGVENHLVAVYGTCFYAGSGPDPGYIYALVPVPLLLPLMQQPGFAGIEDACNTFPCHPLYSRKYPVSR